eukprot:COSAG06_NODE_58455_length_277_cov_0.573034_1_plen_20_part_10
MRTVTLGIELYRGIGEHELH